MTVFEIRLYQERGKDVGGTKLHFGCKMSYLVDRLDVLGGEG